MCEPSVCIVGVSMDIPHHHHAYGRTHLVVEMRIIINRHTTILFRSEFIIFWMIHLDFMRLVDEEPEIIPEFILMSNTFRHNMT